MSTAAEVDTLVIGPAQNGVTMTPEEYDAAQAEPSGYRYELIRGVLIVNPAPSPQERGPNQELGRWLLNYREDHPEGAALDDTLPEHDVPTGANRRRADRVVWTGLGRHPDPDNDVPTIVVEFVSQGRRNWQRDYIEKRDEYLDIGVREYWLFDRFARTLRVYRRHDDGTLAEQQLGEGETYRTELLPGFELPLARLLAVADRWGEHA